MKVERFLSERDIPYELLRHHPTYSATTLAHRVNVPDEQVAKTVLLWADDEYILAVLPATHMVDLERVKDFLLVYLVELASEAECGHQFNDCELGAVRVDHAHGHFPAIPLTVVAESSGSLFCGPGDALIAFGG